MAESKHGKLYLLRHGQTAWAVSGQYTGRTDLPLTAEGERQAIDAGERIRAFRDGRPFASVISSPSQRARMTALRAGFTPVLDGRAYEWDYGRAEGHVRSDVSDALGHDWNIWDENPQVIPVDFAPEPWHDRIADIDVHPTDGETLEEVHARAGSLIEGIRPVIEYGEDVLIVSHAHFSRILATAWLGVDPRFAGHLTMETAGFSVLGEHNGMRVIEKWSC